MVVASRGDASLGCAGRGGGREWCCMLPLADAARWRCVRWYFCLPLSPLLLPVAFACVAATAVARCRCCCLPLPLLATVATAHCCYSLPLPLLLHQPWCRSGVLLAGRAWLHRPWWLDVGSSAAMLMRVAVHGSGERERESSGKKGEIRKRIGRKRELTCGPHM